VRATKADFSESDLRRQKIKTWLDSHGASFLSGHIKIEDPNGHILPGPEMLFDKPGRLPTAQPGRPAAPSTNLVVSPPRTKPARRR